MSTGALRLMVGEPAPVQQSPVSCGAACLTVARMLVDPALTAWIERGRGAPPAGVRPLIDTPEGRFAAHERLIMARTNGVRPRGRWQPPWPTALGTPPWGAARELSHSAANSSTRYGVRPLTLASGRRVGEWVSAAVAPGVPVLLYIGTDALPRHVVLIAAPEPGGVPRVYDPAAGSVVRLAPPTSHEGPLIGRWPRHWFGVASTAVPVPTVRAEPWRRPRWSWQRPQPLAESAAPRITP